MNVFDIIGPVMIGPSSSHTAGAVRLGAIARKILGEPATWADIGLCGSFAETYRGHGTDKALIAGILGMQSDDCRIRNSLELATECGMEVFFHPESRPNAHPNTAHISLRGIHGASASIVGASVGGGNILVTEINGMHAEVSGQYPTLIILHYDRAGTIAAVSSTVADSEVNIGKFQLSRPQKGGEAVMTIEVDGGVPAGLLEQLQVLPNVIKAILIQPV